MKFIVIVIGILLLQQMGSLSAFQQDRWFSSWVARLSGFKWLKPNSYGRPLLSLLVPVFLLVFTLFLLDGIWFGIPILLLSFLVFLYSLGRGDLKEQIAGYRDDLTRDDLQAAYHDAAEFNSEKKVGVAENWEQLKAEVRGAISYRYFERYFAVMFWFILAGAPGALLYRLVVLYSVVALEDEQRKADSHLVKRWLYLLEWLPARLMGLSLAFMGNFTACLTNWRSTLLIGSAGATDVIRGYVTAALESGSNAIDSGIGGDVDSPGVMERELEVTELKALFSRTLIFSLCMVAFLVILI
jgi:AmpE protein